MAGAWGSHGVRSRCNLSKRVGVKEAMDGGVVIGDSSGTAWWSEAGVGGGSGGVGDAVRER